jgi:polysaccharide export outer membrane protein
VTPEAGDEIIISRQPVAAAVTTTAQLQLAGAAEVRRLSLRELQSASTTQNISLRDGDTIHVPPGEKVYITGQVRSPNAYSIRQGTTVLQALALAGGPTDRAATNRVKIRRMVGGEQKEIGAKLDDIVQPGDTIIVPERFF